MKEEATRGDEDFVMVTLYAFLLANNQIFVWPQRDTTGQELMGKIEAYP